MRWAVWFSLTGPVLRVEHALGVYAAAQDCFESTQNHAVFFVPRVCCPAAQSSHMEDKGVQRKELELPPDSKAYCTTVRTGLCNAYLAASVVGSSLVCTNKTGRLGAVSDPLPLDHGDFWRDPPGTTSAVSSSYCCCWSCRKCFRANPKRCDVCAAFLFLSQAGKALQLLSGAVPLVGGLAGFAAAALTAGDRYIQTQRVIKV